MNSEASADGTSDPKNHTLNRNECSYPRVCKQMECLERRRGKAIRLSAFDILSFWMTSVSFRDPTVAVRLAGGRAESQHSLQWRFASTPGIKLIKRFHQFHSCKHFLRLLQSSNLCLYFVENSFSPAFWLVFHRLGHSRVCVNIDFFLNPDSIW